jgi:hypothetical protein
MLVGTNTRKSRIIANRALEPLLTLRRIEACSKRARNGAKALRRAPLLLGIPSFKHTAFSEAASGRNAADRDCEDPDIEVG